MTDQNQATPATAPRPLRLRFYVIWMVLLATGYLVLITAGKGSQLNPFVWSVVGISGITAIVTGVLQYRPAAWKGWLLLATANLFFIIGDVYFKVFHYILHVENPFPSFADIFYLITYPLFAAGMFVFIRRRLAGTNDRGALLDAAIFAVGLTMLVWIYVVIPYAAADATLPAKITSIAYPLGDVLVWAMLVRMLVIDAKNRSIQLLALGALSLVTTDIIYGLSQFYGVWHEDNLVDFGWFLFYASWGAAALHPSMKLLDLPLAKSATIRARRLFLLAATALLAPAILAIEAWRGQSATVAGPIAIFAGILFLLVMLRLYTLVREVSRRDADIALNQQKDEIIGIASHKLRTPLTTIKLYGEQLLADRSNSIPAVIRQDINTINQANQHMIELVNTLLYSSELDMKTVKFKLVPVVLDDVIKAVLGDTRALLGEKRVTPHLAPRSGQAVTVTTDREALRAVLSYLLSNAAHYSRPTGATVTISIGNKQQLAIITIADNGIGIPAADQPLMFTKLFRAANATTSFPDGTGLGLYLARKIVEELGGRIWFTSTLGQGTTVYLALPLDEVPAVKAA